MTRYVHGYELKEEEEKVDRLPFRPIENFYVQYSAEPLWKMSQPEAEIQCLFLRERNVHVGSHFCDFQIEELNESEFAIACVTHPDNLKVVEIASDRSE